MKIRNLIGILATGGLAAAGLCGQTQVIDTAGSISNHSVPALYGDAQASQTIAFPPLTNTDPASGNLAYGQAPFTVSATASSGLAVSFSAGGACSVAFSTVTVADVGTCSITASQAGDAAYSAAQPVTQTYTVQQGNQAISFSPLSNVAYGVAPFTLNALALLYVYLNPPTQSVSGATVYYTSGTTSVCTVSGSTVTIVGPGTCTITASVPGNADFLPAPNVSQSFIVMPSAMQTITFGPLSNVTLGTPPFTISATASSGLPVTFTSNTPSVCTVSGSTVAVNAAGTCSITATQSGNASYSPAPPVTQTFAVNPASQTITFGPLNNVTLGTSPFTISATASSGLAVSFASNTPSICSVSGNTVTVVAAGTCSITATQPGNASYSPAPPVTQTFTVTPALAIATTSLPNGVLNQPYGPFTLAATGGSGTYSWSATGAPPGLTLSAAGILSGKPTASGSFSITFSVTSAGVSVKSTLPLTVGLPTPLVIPGGGGASEVTLTGGAVAMPYSQILPASGGDPPYAWSVIGGSAPAGLSLGSSGTLYGTPTQAGTFTFTGKVTDNSGASATSVFALTVTPQTLTITNGSPFPNGIVGSDYPAQTLSATGGNAPYTFQLTGALPGGLTLVAGQISGIPTVAGTFNFTLTVTDSTKVTASAPFQIAIQPAHADLILSQTSLSFSLSVGATGLPAGANVPVRSSVAAQLLNYSFVVKPAVSWLDVTGGGTTPGAIGISLDPSALNLASGVQGTSIVVTCSTSSPCAGNSQTINVSLTVTTAPPQLAISANLLSFTAQTLNPQPVPQTLGLQNIGGGILTVNSVTAKDNFVTIGAAPSALAAGPAVPVTVTVNPAGLAAGYYQSTIIVNTSAGSASVPVTLLLAQNPTMTLNPAGTQFQQVAGSSPGNPAGSFLVSVSGSGTVSWNAALLPGPNWLQLTTTSGTSTAVNPGSVTFSIIPAVAATLAPQSYDAVIQVTSGAVVDSPQTFLVVLNVAPASSFAMPNPTPAGLLFISSGTTALAPQTVQVFTSSPAPATYQASSDSSWLLVSPASGTASTASPGSSSVSVNPGSLAAGIYRGGVSYALSSAAVRTVNVTLIVQKAAGSDRTSATPLATGTCVPAQLVLSSAATGLLDNFQQQQSFPVGLAVLLVDNCGNPVNNATVSATFSNGDPQLALAPTDTTHGIYSGTWTPASSSQDVTVTAMATASGFSAAATVQLLGQVTSNGTGPFLRPNGTLNAFAIAAEPGVPIAPGSIVQIYGGNLAGQTVVPSTIPLPTAVNQTSVAIGGKLAPLYFVSPGQINAQVPFELAPGPYSVFVSYNGATSNGNPIQLVADGPGIAQFPGSGVINGQHFPSFSPVSETSPAAPGETIIIYVSGMGLTNQTIPSGSATPVTSAAIPLDVPTLTVNGVPATNVSAALTPTLVGLYQVAFTVPPSAPNGDLLLVLTQAGNTSTSTSAILPVHN